VCGREVLAVVAVLHVEHVLLVAQVLLMQKNGFRFYFPPCVKVKLGPNYIIFVVDNKSVCLRTRLY
jgi:hypothetical protein